MCVNSITLCSFSQQIEATAGRPKSNTKGSARHGGSGQPPRTLVALALNNVSCATYRKQELKTPASIPYYVCVYKCIIFESVIYYICIFCYSIIVLIVIIIFIKLTYMRV